jgi:aryl-alcohol dehydrogenase-like predicted oxidoreductase
LTGKYTSADKPPQGSRAETDPNFSRFLDDERMALGRSVSKLADELGSTPSALSLAWLMQQPTVSSVIVGATGVQQLEHNLKSVSLELGAEVLDELGQLSEAYRYGKPFAWYRLPQ